MFLLYMYVHVRSLMLINACLVGRMALCRTFQACFRASTFVCVITCTRPKQEHLDAVTSGVCHEPPNLLACIRDISGSLAGSACSRLAK